MGKETLVSHGAGRRPDNNEFYLCPAAVPQTVAVPENGCDDVFMSELRKTSGGGKLGRAVVCVRSDHGRW